MAKTETVPNKKYPDLTDLFAKMEEAKRKRVSLPIKEKFEMVKKLQKLQAILKSAKVIEKGGVPKD